MFAGPSLATSGPVSSTDLDIRPPAKQGDVYLATLEEPRAIGIIDGYFEGVPSVWHKEILWALKQGIAVFGAASMGALRAAELDVFGMIGVGSIYWAYRDGTIEDDDEVALIHGPMETNYIALSVAMVNVTATCSKALNDGIITRQQYDLLTRAAKAMFYKERTWDTLLANPDNKNLKPFEAWLENNEVDQKALDALEMLDRMQGFLADPASEILHSDFRFENTDLWQTSCQRWRQNQQKNQDSDRVRSGAYRLLDSGNFFR